MSIILVLMLSVVNSAGSMWKTSSARIESFQSARLGFESLTKLLSQATLNTYWDYDNPNAPQKYMRKSELHFLVDGSRNITSSGSTYGQGVFFQAPANFSPAADGNLVNEQDSSLTGQLNACGFFVEFASDKAKGWVPSHVKGEEQNRFRLMQWMQGTKNLDVYDTGSGSSARQWIPSDMLSKAMPVGDNVIALVIWPKEPEKQVTTVLPDQYSYDSRQGVENVPQPPNANQLPPLLQVAMVAMDEASAVRLGDSLQSTVEGCLSGLFANTPSSFDDDLKTLETRLANANINYRVFVSAIPMREAKWSP